MSAIKRKNDESKKTKNSKKKKGDAKLVASEPPPVIPLISSDSDDGDQKKSKKPITKSINMRARYEKIPDKIIGIAVDPKDTEEKYEFLMTWINSDHVNNVPREQANKRWPEVVIKFYEERICWTE